MAQHDTLLDVTAAIDSRTSFLVEAGAGSGKTFALVHGLKHILKTERDNLERLGKKIACITYTNVAKDEISERIAADPLVFVGTIHEFLWLLIAPYQTELKKALVDYNGVIRKPVENLEQALGAVKITYSDRGRKFEEGRIFHDEIIELSQRLFSSYPKMARIAADKFPFLFIDEYQDTARSTVDLVLNYFLGKGASGATVGLFGDSMQKIYGNGVGAVESPQLRTITKVENFRCSVRVIELLNKMRPDLQQVPAGANVDGEVYFFSGASTSEGVGRLENARKVLASKGWTDENTKILLLTHRKIADTLNYSSLLGAYGELGSFGRERLLDGTEPFAQLFVQIELVSAAYVAKDYASLFRYLAHDGARLLRHADKIRFAKELRELVTARQNGSVGEVIDYVFRHELLGKADSLRRTEERAASGEDERAVRTRSFIEALRTVPYSEVVAFSEFRDTQTPFATQHGVKGAEFPNVIVAIDDASWVQYNMGKLLAGTDNLPARIERSRNLFYVCCSRAQSGLAVVFLSTPPSGAIDTARRWFGQANTF